MKQKIKKFWPELVIVLAVLFFLRKILFGGEIFVTPGMGLSDYSLGIYPQSHYLSTALKEGRFPLWAPEIYGGFPFAANGESAPFYPLNLLLFYFFSPQTGLALYNLFTFLLLGLATFYFLKSLKLSSEAALIAALSFTFSSGLIVKIVHFDSLAIIAHLPLALLTTHQYFEKKRPLLLVALTLVLAMQILLFDPQSTFLAFLTFSLYFLFKVLIETKKKQISANLLTLIIVFLLAFSLSAAQIVPSLNYFRLSVRKTGVSQEKAAEYPLIFKELAYFLRPTPFGDPSLGNYDSPVYPTPSIFWENNSYIGLVGLLLGILAILFMSRHKEVIFFGSLLVFSLLLALGKSTPLFFLLRLPPFSFFRIHSRFLILSMFSLSILAAFGFEALSQKFKKKKTLVGLTLAIIILIDLFSFGLDYNPTYKAKDWLSPPESAQLIKKDPTFFRTHMTGQYEAFLILYRQFDGWRKNVGPYFGLRELLPPNLPLNWEINQAEGHIGFGLQRLADWTKYLERDTLYHGQTGTIEISPMAIKMLRLKNVKYLMSPFKLDGPEFSLKKETFFADDQPRYFVFELKDPAPHAFIVHQSKFLKEGEDFWEELNKDEFDFKKTVLLEENSESLPEILSPSEDEVEILEYLPEKVTLKTSSKEPGFLILTDNYFPEWHAQIDNQPVKILRANYLHRAVRLKPGEHRIVFTYQPKSVLLGIKISLITLAIILVFSLYLLIRKRRFRAAKKD